MFGFEFDHEVKSLEELLRAEAEGQPIDLSHAVSLAKRLAMRQDAIAASMSLLIDRWMPAQAAE